MQKNLNYVAEDNKKFNRAGKITYKIDFLIETKVLKDLEYRETGVRDTS